MDSINFEDAVRSVSSYIWNTAAKARSVNGVKCDAVLEVELDYWVLIEATQEETLAKLRTDLAKFQTVKPYLMSQGVYAKCLFVCEREPTDSMVEAGRGCDVEVMSLNRLNQRFFDFKTYHHVRRQKPFGSAVDPVSGEADLREYVPVIYESSNGKSFTIEDILRLVNTRNHVVLIGDYGSGKSRCVRQVFENMGASATPLDVALAINLRDNWGTVRGHEIVRRHFDDLGLSGCADKVIRIADTSHLHLLLDGFDEIGSQTWSDDPSKLQDIRRKSLLGVKDLITAAKGGVLITGREHYFNSDEEMFECLGLDPARARVLRCPREFTDEQVKRYLGDKMPPRGIPHWVPKRPLICQIVARFDERVMEEILGDDGEVQFWDCFIEAICSREARINQAILDPGVTREVLQRVARLTRSKPNDVGPIKISEINKAFEAVTGKPAVDESAAMLQRLPALGRIGPESTERQFVDTYVLDGLRAEDTRRVVNLCEDAVKSEWWMNPLRHLGLSILARDIEIDASPYLRMLVEASRDRNAVFACDIVAAYAASSLPSLDGQGMAIRGGHITSLLLNDISVRNLGIEECVIDYLDITDAQVENIRIENCMITTVVGVSDSKGMPLWCQRNDVRIFDKLATVARIKAAPLTEAQRIFVTIIKKTFFQPGAGRQEEALTRGLGESGKNKKLVKKILKILLEEEMLTRGKGDDGWVYRPARHHTRRVEQILARLTLSDDFIWNRISEEL